MFLDKTRRPDGVIRQSVADMSVLPVARSKQWGTGLLAAAAWLGFSAVTGFLPDIDDFERTRLLAAIAAGLGVILALLATLASVVPKAISDRARHVGPWLLLLAVIFAAWELVTAKFPVLPRPFFASPQAMLEVFTDDYENSD